MKRKAFGEPLAAGAAYTQAGWYAMPQRLPEPVIDRLRESVARISVQDRPEVVFEDGTQVVRALHGCHRFDEACAALTRLPVFVALAESLVGGPAYVYQFKVNLKQPFQGRAWPWHQDFAFWLREDGMPTPNAVNIAVFLDDVHAGNGPLTVIPGSHRLGLLDIDTAHRSANSQDWRRHVSADLEYTIDENRVAELAADLGRHVAVGERGSCFAFHPCIVHTSSNNESPDRRAMLLITYNATNNAPPSPSRPEFLVDRITTPLVADDGFPW
ncbi:phytanoyl-CoA dioxygenase family protein [Dactylosporangium sp. NPDC000244]|uniref:phytanoyl-CoA dioxygenase family protein n=1 Tax=Dactylosporangium sp. NPDC000244 TaxID=3154365 RepID=UPI0033299880